MQLTNLAHPSASGNMIPITREAAKRNTARYVGSERPHRRHARPIATRIEPHTTSADRSHTLAIELAYRPGGLLAAKVALKHISVVTTEGYAGRPGGAQAKFLAEVGAEEQKRNLGLILDEIDNYQRGVRPSGPHARDLIEFFDAVDGKLTDEQRAAPKIILNDQELRRMLAKRAKTLHLGVANYCWFTDPRKALCLRLAGTPTADRPLIGMCDSARCPQATHHTCHRPVWEQAMHSTTVFLGNLGRAQKTERTRLEAQLDRARRVLADIDAASTPAGTDEEVN